MKKNRNIREIKKQFVKGKNIIQYLNELDSLNNNSDENILISYDLQSGTYIDFYHKNIDFIQRYSKILAQNINILDNFSSILEVGVGEGTTLAPTIAQLTDKPKKIFGFDISLSRVLHAQKFIKHYGINDVTLFTANLFQIPLPDNAIDVVYTSHSVEPNGGREKEALQELYRITNKYLILLEPSYEYASKEGKKRMSKLGYVKNLFEHAVLLGYKIIKHELFPLNINKLNPTEILIIEKLSRHSNQPELVCPNTKHLLKKISDCTLFSTEGMLAYPIINTIPCLLTENAILSTHLEKFIQSP